MYSIKQDSSYVISFLKDKLNGGGGGGGVSHLERISAIISTGMVQRTP